MSRWVNRILRHIRDRVPTLQTSPASRADFSV